MKIVIRADASVWIGSGHIMRCLVLADELREAGHFVQFACLPQPGDLRALIRNEGFEVISLDTVRKYITIKHEADYLSWLQRPVLVDAQDFVAKVRCIDAVITDHYAIGYEWQAYVKKALSCKIIAIDDIVRTHCADIVIDPTLGRLPEEYKAQHVSLTGSDYALLNKNFSLEREKVLNARKITTPWKILVFMGGSDLPNSTLEILQALEDTNNAHITVILSPRSAHYDLVSSWCTGKKHIIHIDFCKNMAELMVEHNIGIGAAGTTSFERACVGLPSLLIPIAENQKENCKNLVKAGVGRAVQLKNVQTRCRPELHNLVREYNTYSKNAFQICDGIGAKRVTQWINEFLENFPTGIYMKKAKYDDKHKVYEWIGYSHKTKYHQKETITCWKRYCRWFEKKISEPSSFCYMIREYCSKKSLGIVWLDRIGLAKYKISLIISPNQHNPKTVTKTLNIINQLHPKIGIIMDTNTINLPQQSFIEAGYIQISSSEFFREEL